MGKICMLTFTLLALLLHGCLGRQYGIKSPNACRLDQLNSLEPNRRVGYEAGEVEFWNHNAPQLQCAGVSVFRLTIKPNGIRLPLYRSSPSLGYVVSGQGIRGVVIPGCAETYLDAQSILKQGRQQQEKEQQSQGPQRGQQEKEQQSQQEEQEQGEQSQRPQWGKQEKREQSQQEEQQQSQQREESERSEWGEQEQFPDMHQKVERLKQGDVIALQEGVTEWFFNDGKNPLVIVVLADLSSVDNQLDRNLRTFLLAGNDAQQGQQSQQGQGEQGQQGKHGQQGQEVQHSQEWEQISKNVFNGFGDRIIAQSFKVNVQTANKLKNQNDKRGNIVFAKKGLQVIIPPTQQENGLEETVCSLRLQENIDNPSHADVYAPDAGRISTVNSHTLPVLRQIQLSAVRGVLYSRGIYLPHWNLNANAIIYATGGQARLQVVDDNGNSVFDGQLQKGQLLVVPQGFAVVTRAKQNGFEFITFKTNDNAIIQTLAGRTSAIKGLPEQLLEIAYQISPREAKQLKYNTIATTLTKAKLGRQEYDEE